MHIIISEKEKITSFSIAEGEMIITWGKNGIAKEQYQGYSFTNNTPCQIYLSCSNLIVMVYFSSFSEIYNNLEDLKKYLQSVKSFVGSKADISQVVMNLPDAGEIDMIALHAMMEEKSGMKIQY